MVAETESPDGPEGGRCCRCSGLCGKFKKIFCLQETYNVSVDSTEGPKIEHSAVEYGLRYVHELDEPLAVGSLVTITGTPSEDIPRFEINVGAGDAWSKRCDIVLHLNPRMPQRYVVRNTRRLSTWGSEETTSFRSFPFKPGRKFTVELLVAENEWLVAVDGKHYCSYAHRLPAAGATWVQVTDIAQPTVDVRQIDAYPSTLPTPQEIPHRVKPDAESGDEPEWAQNTCGLLPRGLQQGEQVVVSGRLRALPHSFIIELAEEWHEWPHPVVHLHVNPRLCASPTRAAQLVVLNSWAQGGWGAERRQASARLIGGSDVTVKIVRGPSEWLVWADDTLLGELTFRADADRVRVLRLRGDLLPRRIYTSPAD